MALQDVIALLSSSLVAQNPGLDLRPGTPFADLFLTSTAVAYNVIDQEVQHDRIVSYLSNWQSMTLEELQLLASNFFVNYASGTFSTGSVRVYYSSPVDFMATPLSNFYSSAGYAYKPVTPVVVTKDEMSLNRDGLLYYVDVEVSATSTGSMYNITSSGQIVNADGIPDFVRITNLQPFSNAQDPMTLDQFYSVIANSLTTRDFVSKASIFATLMQHFPYINRLTVVGYGDPEMTRDIVRYSPSGTMHAGSMIDVYLDFNGNPRTGNNFTLVSAPALPTSSTPIVADWGNGQLIPTQVIYYAPPTGSSSGGLEVSQMYCPYVVFGTIDNLVNLFLLNANLSGSLIQSDQIRLPITAVITSPGTGVVTSDGALDFGLGTFGGGWFGIGDGYDFILSVVSGTELSDRAPIYMIFNPAKYNPGAFTVSFSYEEKTGLLPIDTMIRGNLRNTVTDVQARQTYPLVVDLVITINNYDPVLNVSGTWSSYTQAIVQAIGNYIRSTPVTNGLYVGDIINIIYGFNSSLRVVTPFDEFRVTLYHPNNAKEVFWINGSFTNVSSSYNPIITNRLCSFYPGIIILRQGISA